MSIEELKKFMENGRTRIDDTLVSKLRILGYYKEDILSGDKPLMKRYVLREGNGHLHEEYVVNGIRLFEAIWEPGILRIIDSAI